MTGFHGQQIFDAIERRVVVDSEDVVAARCAGDDVQLVSDVLVADTDSEHVYAGVVQARRLLLRHDAIIRLAVSDDDGHFDDTVAHLFFINVIFQSW